MASSAQTRGESRMAIASRTVVAIFGSYGLAAFAAMAIARCMPLETRDAVTFAEMIGLLLYTASVIWAFSTDSVRSAWIGVGGANALAIGACFLTGGVL